MVFVGVFVVGFFGVFLVLCLFVLITSEQNREHGNQIWPL